MRPALEVGIRTAARVEALHEGYRRIDPTAGPQDPDDFPHDPLGKADVLRTPVQTIRLVTSA